MLDRIVSATLAEIFLQAGDRWGSRPGFLTRSHEGVFQAVTYRSWCDRALSLATALIELGITAREHLGLLSDNRFEWILADAAVQFCGAVDVPRASNITDGEIVTILNHADVKVVFVEHRALLNRLESLRKDLPQLTHIIVMEKNGEPLPPGILSMQALEAHGAELRHLGDRSAEKRIAQIQPEDLFTIIYTSGTTGPAKGVQLTHRAICSQLELIPFQFSSREQERALSILPVWHSYERVFEMLLISQGASLYYTSVRHLARDLISVKPTVMASAPRVWEALYEKIMVRIAQQSRFKKTLFAAACSSAHAVRSSVQIFRGEELRLEKRSQIRSLYIALQSLLQWGLGIIPFLILDPLVLKNIRKSLGGAFRATISGGGALPPHIDAFFQHVGIRIFEGYGLTESAPVLAVRTTRCFVLGTVGSPLPETEIKIVDLVTGKILYPDSSHADGGRGARGEICARGPQIMKGYYKDPEGTARVLRDGWLHTGDIGLVTFNDCLKIVGRCKETIVLLNGENVEPLPIESKLLESPFIEQCMVVGQDQKQLGALIVPSLTAFAERGFSASSPSELLEQEEKVTALFQEEIRCLVSAVHGFKSFERIGPWRLLPKAFEVGDELTPTYKLKRHVITERYRDLLEEMFS